MTSSPTDSEWVAVLYLTPGSALYLGPLAATSRHRHHAVQACVGTEAGFRLRLGARDPWRTFTAAVVDADVSHEFDGSGGLHAMLYLEPESGTGRLSAIPTVSGVSALESDRLDSIRRCMVDTVASRFLPERVLELHRRMLHLLGREASERHPLDQRIGRLLETMRRSPDAAWSLPDAAKVLALSPSRARHLFIGEMGISLRRFRRWIRLEAALHVLADGESLTTAAHSAGFADSAHLSRAFREMFGMTPSRVTGFARILVDRDRV